jgi:hypothetical protein
MKLIGAIIAISGALLFAWHLVKIVLGADYGSAPLSHHLMSLIGGVLLFVGIWIYSIARRRARRAAGTPIE